MALIGQPSTAHKYEKPKGQCIYCGMYQNVAEELGHACTREREIATDGYWLGKKYGGE
jgi:hypothetical protein